MFRPITGLAHWPDQPCMQPGASGFRGLKLLTYSNWEMGSANLITVIIFKLNVCVL